jgi:hypothetical protein
MRDVTRATQQNPLPHQRLRLIAFVGLVLIFGIWARYHFTNLQVNRDRTSEPYLAAAKEKTQSLLEALEQYRAANGLYPATLDLITLPHGASSWGQHSHRYSARRDDWVFKSDACAAREKSLHGLILKNAKDYEKEVTDFKSECVTGYRYYQLQSRNFPHDPQIPYLDRWAYYDSSNRQWSVGWCSHQGRRASEFGINGVCRWEEHPASDPW